MRCILILTLLAAFYIFPIRVTAQINFNSGTIQDSHKNNIQSSTVKGNKYNDILLHDGITPLNRKMQKFSKSSNENGMKPILINVEDSQKWIYSYDSYGNYLYREYDEYNVFEWEKLWTQKYTYDTTGKILSSIYESFGPGNSEFDSLYTYTYDSNGYLISFLKQKKHHLTDKWNNVSRTFYTNDSTGTMFMEFTDAWSWENVWIYGAGYRYNSTFDGHQNMTSRITEIWSPASDSWENKLKLTYTYDDKDSMTSFFTSYWKSGSWDDANKYGWTKSFDSNGNLLSKVLYDNGREFYRYTYTYDAHGNVLTSANEVMLSNGNWATYDKFTYTYDEMDRKLSSTYQRSGVDKEKINYFYGNSANPDTEILQVWKPDIWDSQIGYWENDLKHIYTYDNNGNMLEDLQFGYYAKYPAEKDWHQFFKVNYSYDAYGNTTKGEQFEWNDSVWVRNHSYAKYLYLSYNNGRQLVFYSKNKVEVEYGLVTEVTENHPVVMNFSLSQNYPNPFNPATVISYRLSAAGNITLKVYDILGREISTLVNTEQNAGIYKVTFDASNLSAGIYFYKLQAGNSTIVKKMIFLK